MPTTINGIGTHYYGHKNVQRIVGTCRSCGRQVNLESYDTRLWFVVVFIPIIPLGRKRIIDQCSACRRHYVISADQWETQKQLNISGALEQFRSDPTAENAIAAHQQYLNFHQANQAAEFRREIAEQFRDNAKVQAYFGTVVSDLGRLEEGLVYYRRAFELRPDLPEARVGLALGHIRSGQLAEARGLLDFLEKPGAVQFYSLSPIETLADAYARAGDRQQALELYQKLQEALPQIGEYATFRKKVKECEKALGAPSILPKQKFSLVRLFSKHPGTPPWQRTLAFGVTAVLVVAIGFAIRNEYIRQHRPLYLVNAFRDAATVEIQGVDSVRVGPSYAELELKEGRYHAIVTGPIRQEFDFEIASSYMDRWWNDDDIWVVNVGGESLLLETRATYAEEPSPPTINVHFGTSFEHVPGVTHRFVSLPETVQMKSGETRLLVQLDKPKESAADIAGYLQTKHRTGEALRLLEWRLRSHPEDETCLFLFANLAPQKQAEEFLRAGLSKRPVQIPWHRMYQSLHSGASQMLLLTEAYEQMLRAEPQNGSLLYLRGRVEPDGARANAYYEQAKEREPHNPYPYYALGYRRSALGDWQGARALYARTMELGPTEEFERAYFSSRFALKEYTDLERELRAQIKKAPQNFEAVERLIDVLVAQDRGADARAVVDAASRDATRYDQQNAAVISADLRRHLYYATGDFDALAQAAKNDRSPSGRNSQFIALLEQNKLAEAERMHPLDEPDVTDPYHFLSVGLACTLAGDAAASEKWLQRGVELLNEGTADDVRAAALLTGKAEATGDQIDALDQAPARKATLLAAIGMHQANHRAELFAAAQKLNVGLEFPFHLIRKVTTETH